MTIMTYVEPHLKNTIIKKNVAGSQLINFVKTIRN